MQINLRQRSSLLCQDKRSHKATKSSPSPFPPLPRPDMLALWAVKMGVCLLEMKGYDESLRKPRILDGEGYRRGS